MSGTISGVQFGTEIDPKWRGAKEGFIVAVRQIRVSCGIRVLALLHAPAGALVAFVKQIPKPCCNLRGPK